MAYIVRLAQIRFLRALSTFLSRTTSNVSKDSTFEQAKGLECLQSILRICEITLELSESLANVVVLAEATELCRIALLTAANMCFPMAEIVSDSSLKALIKTMKDMPADSSI
jgi:hypothetical protein